MYVCLEHESRKAIIMGEEEKIIEAIRKQKGTSLVPRNGTPKAGQR